MRGPLTGARICVWSTDRKQQSRPNGRLCCYGSPQYLPFACQCVICGVLGRRSGRRFAGLHAEAGLHHTAVEAAAGRVLTGLAHRGELAACGGHRRIYVVTHRFCCPNSRISQGRGSVRGEPLTGSPARVQSPARRRPILHSKIAAPKKKRHTFVCLFFFGASSGIRTPDTLLKRQVLYLLS